MLLTDADYPMSNHYDDTWVLMATELALYLPLLKTETEPQRLFFENWFKTGMECFTYIFGGRELSHLF